MQFPKPLLTLIEQLRKLPGVGLKSAERLAFSLIDWDEKSLTDFASAISSLPSQIESCCTCGAWKDQVECRFCAVQRRSHQLCVVASPKDIYLFEQTGAYKGAYHVLGGVLSPILNQTPPKERLSTLKERIQADHIEELILALDSTLEGDATALYLKKELADFQVSLTRLALGLPMGTSLDYIDEGTLARALSGRLQV